MDFQVGEKVRIRSRKDLLCEYGTDNEGKLYVSCDNSRQTYHSPRMAEYDGFIAIVKEWFEESRALFLEDTGWEWNQNMVYRLNETEV